MAGSDPRETAEAIHAAINAGDVAAVMACFGDHPVFLPPGAGAEVRGREAVEETMRAFLATDPKITPDVVRCVVTGAVALVVAEWRARSARRGCDTIDRHRQNGCRSHSWLGRSVALRNRQSGGDGLSATRASMTTSKLVEPPDA